MDVYNEVLVVELCNVNGFILIYGFIKVFFVYYF